MQESDSQCTLVVLHDQNCPGHGNERSENSFCIKVKVSGLSGLWILASRFCGQCQAHFVESSLRSAWQTQAESKTTFKTFFSLDAAAGLAVAVYLQTFPQPLKGKFRENRLWQCQSQSLAHKSYLRSWSEIWFSVRFRCTSGPATFFQCLMVLMEAWQEIA